MVILNFQGVLEQKSNLHNKHTLICRFAYFTTSIRTAALDLMPLAAVFALQAGHESKTFILFEKMTHFESFLCAIS